MKRNNDLVFFCFLLIAPVGIEMNADYPAGQDEDALLIAPVGIEITSPSDHQPAQ